MYANFVASVDGVTALGPEYPLSGSAISGHSPADRFVMGRCGSCADVVLIGAGTLRATPGHPGWSPGGNCSPAGPAGLLTVRRHGSYLFLRYAMRGVADAGDAGGG